jgi:hypothetical protein
VWLPHHFKPLLPSSVGFLTSDSEKCRPSAILVSKEEALVCLVPVDKKQKERGADGMALGYRQVIRRSFGSSCGCGRTC